MQSRKIAEFFREYQVLQDLVVPEKLIVKIWKYAVEAAS